MDRTSYQSVSYTHLDVYKRQLLFFHQLKRESDYAECLDVDQRGLRSVARAMRHAFGGECQGAFWFTTYEGAINAELFAELLKKMTKHRKKPAPRAG